MSTSNSQNGTMTDLRELIQDLQAGASVDEVRQRFQQIIRNADAADTTPIQSELISQGVPREMARRWSEEHIDG